MSFKVKREPVRSSWYLPGILVGLGFTFKKMLQNLFNQKKMVTLNYPEEKYQYGPRFKGNHVLTVKKDGSLRCTACMLCATNCPADCIRITASEHEDPSVEKFPISYEIDILRCVFCGFCEEACPVDAIRMGPEWQTAALNGSEFTYDIRHLAYRPQLKGGVPSVLDDQERHSAGI
ncbi:MAG TPA: NADH-quinone oxidoreductase subunit I [Bdellovibrionales bacterium]|nr:NADH-quinone oxidoreductase subunit I [Pseudobdellovibrionaceae bacterium]HAG91302.1 NADH-quinone oxidoreductase subunit I [Bdellovibrionales bacterium]|tara:strand:- start:465 stop:992 length:528 start_codon:yes stop_codon:yes gene_type:complete